MPNLTPVQAAAAAYIDRFGIKAFMDEEYNLAGTRVRAVVTTDNVELARAMGIPLPADELPVAVSKNDIMAVFDGPRRDAYRAAMAAFFADPANATTLSNGQRMFMEWHYRSPNSYQYTLSKPLAEGDDKSRILGWNQETEHIGEGDFHFYTGLLGCTGLCAVAADGSAFMSHWDQECNPRQLDGYARFAANHPGGTVYVVGAVGHLLTAELRRRHPELDIRLHRKKIYMEFTYTVSFARRDGQVEIRFFEAPVTDDYVSSTHNGDYGRWFPYGRFGEAFPGADDEFLACTFESVA